MIPRDTRHSAVPGARPGVDSAAMETHWPDYYRVTADRPAWATTVRAAEAFGSVAEGSRLAVDLGCGAGRDTRELEPRALAGRSRRTGSRRRSTPSAPSWRPTRRHA